MRLIEEPQILNLREAAEKGRADRIEALVQTEEQLNQDYNNHHALWYAARADQVLFIQKLLKFAAEKGWRIIEPSSDFGNDLALNMAVLSNNFFCVQALALHQAVPMNMFSFERAHIHRLNQIPLTLVALTKNESKRKAFLGMALLEAMRYGIPENYQRFCLLLELGANPHITYYDGRNFTCPLTLCAGSAYVSSKNDLEYPRLPQLLASLNSKTINHEIGFYESSIREFFAEEIKLIQEILQSDKLITDFLIQPRKNRPRAKWGSGGGFLHWAAAMGHSEILGDIIDSFYSHQWQTRMFYPDHYGNTPLTCALLAEHETIARRLVVEELRQVSLGGRMYLEHTRDQFFLLNFLNSNEITGNVEFYRISLCSFFEISPKRYSCSLLHWAAFSGHAEIVPSIIQCFRTHGIPLHHPDTDEKTPLDLAKEKGHQTIVEILESTKEVKIQKFQHIPDLRTKLLLEHQRKILGGEMTLAEFKEGMLPGMLSKLEELKPNVSMMEFLNPKFYQEEGKTPFMVLCERNRLDLVQKLLPFLTPEDIEMQDLEEGNTALHLACAAGAGDVVRFLSEKYPYRLNEKSKSGLIPILCATSVDRKRILEQDNSGLFLNSLLHELDLNLRPMLAGEARIILTSATGFFASSQNDARKQLGQQMHSLANSGKTEDLMSLLIKRLEEAPEESIRLLEALNNNAVLRAALGLLQKNLALDSVREDYCLLVLERLKALELELESFNREPNSLGKR